MRDVSDAPGIWHARRAGIALAGALRRRSARGLVLLYHRIAGPRRDPQWLDVSPENFAAQMAWIARNTAPMPLLEFESRRRSSTLPCRAVAVTFDDGYADNLLSAAPVLAAAGVPATAFVTAGMVGATREFWWDDAERIAFSSRQLDAPVPSVTIAWSASDGAPIADATRDEWTIAQPGDPTPRHRLYRAICAAVRPLTAGTREEMMRALREWAGVPSAARPTHRALTAAELRDMASRPGIAIGAHTMTHPVLSQLPAAEQHEELMNSRLELERELRQPVPVAAYPYGTRADVSADTARAAQSAGFDFAMANEPGAAWRWSSRWRVPRNLVRDWNAATFASRLEVWFAE